MPLRGGRSGALRRMLLWRRMLLRGRRRARGRRLFSLRRGGSHRHTLGAGLTTRVLFRRGRSGERRFGLTPRRWVGHRRCGGSGLAGTGARLRRSWRWSARFTIVLDRASFRRLDRGFSDGALGIVCSGLHVLGLAAVARGLWPVRALGIATAPRAAGLVFRQRGEEFLNPVAIALLDAAHVFAAPAARIDERGLVVLEFRPLLLRELPAGPVIDIGELLIEFPEPGILADCLFVGGTRVAAIEALCAGRGIESGGNQESAQRGGGDMRRQCGAASEARHHSLALRRVVPAFHKHQHRIARNPMYLSTNDGTARLPVYRRDDRSRRRALCWMEGTHAERRLSLPADGKRDLRPALCRGGQGAGRAERRHGRLSAGERHLGAGDRPRRPDPRRARQPAGRRACQDRRPHAAHRCRRGR